MLAADLDLDIAVDTYRHTRTAAAQPDVAVLERLTLPADPRGYRWMIAYWQRHREARLRGESREPAVSGAG